MLATIEKLLVVQDRDSKIAQLRRELARLPQERAEADAALAKSNADLEAARNGLKAEELERKKLEIEVETKKASIAKWRGQQNQIKSNVEYQALNKEIATAEEEISQIEDKELLLMEQETTQQKQIKDAQASAKATAERVAKLKTDLDTREKTVQARLAALETERAEFAKQVDEDLIERYERIFRSKHDLAIAPIEHGNCSGCHLQLPPEIVHAAKGGIEVASCSNCGRIVYWAG